MPTTSATQLHRTVHTLVWLLYAGSSICKAESDPEQDAIDHIIAIEGIRAIQQDKSCAYAAKTVTLPQHPYREVTAKLSDGARRGIELELSSPSTKAKITTLGTIGRDVIQRMAPSGLDKNTLCGIWFGFAVTEYSRTARKLGLKL